MTPFKEKLREILKERGITLKQFGIDTGISRERFFYNKDSHRHRLYVYMAIAYYLDMTVEDLVEGTDGEIDWYGDAGI